MVWRLTWSWAAMSRVARPATRRRAARSWLGVSGRGGKLCTAGLAGELTSLGALWHLTHGRLPACAGVRPVNTHFPEARDDDDDSRDRPGQSQEFVLLARRCKGFAAMADHPLHAAGVS